jgi:serine/threonine protein kinase
MVNSSDSASIQERVLLHLNELLFCVEELNLIASESVPPDDTFFKSDVLNLLTPDVEAASRRDIESLFRTIEGYTKTSVLQGDAMKLAEYVLDKFRAANSNHGRLEYDDVQLGDFLGNGSFGSVFKCQFLGMMAAVKVFRTSSRWTAKAAENEANLQARLRHPNVVQFIGYAVKGSQHIIVSELMTMDLWRYLDEKYSDENRVGHTGPPLPLLLAIDIMLQIAEAMKYLHHSGVMHRDLCAKNVLINVVESKDSSILPSLQVKITDFGSSKLNLHNSRFTSMQIGTTVWRAPEVFEDEQNTEKYTKAADVYSFAMVFFQVLTGEMPFKNIQRHKVLSRIRHGERPTLPSEDYCPAYLAAFIKKCWATRAADRPKFPEICQMLWKCKGMILRHSHPHPSPQNSEPQKFRNDGGYNRSILAMVNIKNLFQAHGTMMAKMSGRGFRSTNSDRGHLHLIAFDDVHRGKECLGNGSFGSVFKCQCRGEIAAVKIFLTSNITEVKAVENEVNLLARLQHPNVVRFIGYAFKGREHFIVAELMSMDLRRYLEENVHEGQSSPPLSLLLAVDIMLQLAEAMKYLHESGVMHRDLKSNNVLVNVIETEDSHLLSSVQVKVADFGMSKLNMNNSMFTTMQVGKAQWRAPEVFEDEQNTEKYTKAADVYSFAMVFFEVLTGEIPFAKIRPYQIFLRVRFGDRPTLPPEDSCPGHLSAFIKECWATQPKDRPKFPEICQMLQECKGMILSHSSPHPSLQNSEPQKHRNDGDYTRSILATDNSENLFQGSGRMVDVSGGRFKATNPDHGLLHLIEYEDVCIGKECLGIGAFGVVFKCTFHGEMAAAQIMLTSNIPEVEAVENEVNIRARLQHPNVVQFIGYAIKGSQHVIVMELMSKDLRAYLHENVHDGQTIPQLVAVDIMLQLAEAMTYLHESGVMHRDLNPENVLVNVPETEDLHLLSSVQAKITGFGMSKLNLNNSRFTTRQVGKAQWRAPEVFEDEQNTEKYTKAADVYSFAMVFFEVLTGEVPFANIPKNQILPRIRDGERPTLPPEDCCAAHLSAVIKKCWATRAEDRPKFVEICQMLVSCKDLILSHSSTNPSSQSSKS